MPAKNSQNFQIPPTVTPVVFAHLRHAMGENAVLRVAVEGGGCSGFQYKIEPGVAKDDDYIIAHEGVCVVIDPLSLPFLRGAVIDLNESLMGVRFEIKNPNAASACGCGTSFSI